MSVYIFQLTLIDTEIKIHIDRIYFSQNINDNFQSLEKKFKEIHDFVEDMKKPKNSEFISEKIIEIKSDIESLVSMILPEMGYLPKNFFDDGTRHYNDYYNYYYFLNNNMLLIQKKYIKLTEILTIITYLIKENFGALNTRQKMLSLANEIFKKIYLEYIEDENNIKYNLNLYNWLDYYEVIPNSYNSQYFGVRKVDKNKDFSLENLNKFYENNQKKFISLYLVQVLNMGEIVIKFTKCS